MSKKKDARIPALTGAVSVTTFTRVMKQRNITHRETAARAARLTPEERKLQAEVDKIMLDRLQLQKDTNPRREVQEPPPDAPPFDRWCHLFYGSDPYKQALAEEKKRPLRSWFDTLKTVDVNQHELAVCLRSLVVALDQTFFHRSIYLDPTTVVNALESALTMSGRMSGAGCRLAAIQKCSDLIEYASSRDVKLVKCAIFEWNKGKTGKRIIKGKRTFLRALPLTSLTAVSVHSASGRNSIRGVTLTTAAMLRNDQDNAAAQQAKKRWNNKRSIRPPAPIGISMLHKQAKIYEPSALVTYLVAIHEIPKEQKAALIKALDGQAVVGRKISKKNHA